MRDFTTALSPFLRDGIVAAAILLVSAIVGLLAHAIVLRVLTHLARKRADGVFAAVLHRAEAPSRFVFPLVALALTLPEVTLPRWLKDPVETVFQLCIIAAVAWTVVALIELVADLAKRQYRIDDPDNLRARQVETRLDILKRTAGIVVILVSIAAMLMTFPPIRAVGATLLASAGLAAIAAGVAARPFLENLVAGVQIALTQPIRIDDVVIVETEYGKIEKITATYVVVCLWDLRRMVLPLTYFINTPFQNWTYSSASLIGSVFLYLNYSVPLDAIRSEMPNILAATPLWDGSVVNVAMTDTKDSVVEVRVLVSARTAPALFDLRCLVRERLVAFVRDTYPKALPSTTIVLEQPAAGAGDGRPRFANENQAEVVPPERAKMAAAL
jgi:small-conductance mechanosensitive channel